MIKLELTCYNGHTFNASFRDEDTFATLKADDHLACPACGVCDIDKTVAPLRGDSQVDPSLRACQPVPDQIGLHVEILS